MLRISNVGFRSPDCLQRRACGCGAEGRYGRLVRGSSSARDLDGGGGSECAWWGGSGGGKVARIVKGIVGVAAILVAVDMILTTP